MGRDDDDNELDDLLDRVDAALDALDLGNDEVRSSLLDGVKDALEQALEALPEGVETEVVVVDGSAAHSDGAPHLRVVEDDEAPEPTGLEGFTEVRPGEWVKRLTLDGRTKAPRTDQGHIAMDDEGWQTLFRGPVPRAYRIACGRGVLEVALDGQLVEQVHPGQTLDVEAALIRVHASGPVRGAYQRL